MTDDLNRIIQLAEELCDPHHHIERVYDRDRHGNLTMARAWTTTQPGLLQQLADTIPPTNTPTDDQPHTTTYTSRPPLSMEALSRHAAIAIAAARWCWSLHIDLRDTTESNIRALVGAATHLDSDTRHQLATELRQWRTWAAVMTGWATPLYCPHAPCPIVDCGRRDTLRVNLAARRAMCSHCGSVWDDTDGSIYVLADHIRAASAAA